MTTEYTPELMPGFEIVTDIVARYSAIVRKYRVTCKTKIARLSKGMTADGVVEPTGANNTSNVRAGWFKYYMTERAFDAFAKANDITVINNLD